MVQGSWSDVLGDLTQSAYQNVLDAGLFQIYDSDSVFVQDNAPCHKSKLTMKYLEKNHICLQSASSISILNIIENLWSILKSKVDKRSPKSTSELWKSIEEEFYLIPDSVIINLYDSIPQRLQAVLNGNCTHTKYRFLLLLAINCLSSTYLTNRMLTVLITHRYSFH